ncbi:MAG: hypothetical protein Ct9H90mP3_0420 [Flammeovirgaceae bacterium]|nr:MAG: hypothetical protein Ct9H90mP3_0420 [Flammeovirgaceae bacterium]
METMLFLVLFKDSIKSHQKFIEKFVLNFDLISDEDKSYIKCMETRVEKKKVWKTYMGTARQTFY